LQADIVLLEIGKFLFEVVAQQAPERFDLDARPLPILHREGIQGEGFDSQPRAGFHCGAYRADARLMSGHSRQPAPAGPAPIAIHNDGDVGGQAGGVDRLRQIPVFPPWLQRFQ